MSAIEVGLGISQLADTVLAVKEAVAAARRCLSVNPAMAFISTTVEHSAERFWAAVRAELPGVPLSGITTSLGILGSRGVVAGASGVVGVQLLASPSGTVTFATGGAEITTCARTAARAAAQKIALEHPGKRPSVLLVTASPGAEEAVIQGLADVFADVPAYGGSAADHAIAGQWSAFTNEGAYRRGVAIAAVFGSVKVGGAFVTPYDATSTTAVVTKAEGRIIQTLDHRPAATVLGEWVGESIADQVATGGVVLAQTALSPLALVRARGTETHYIPTHPYKITQPGSNVAVFTLPSVGDSVCLLRGSVEGLTANLALLVNQALESGGLSRDTVRGGVLIYCAGCAGAVGGELDCALREHVGRLLGDDVPLLGLCTFGEQGYVPGLGNMHHNLSLGLVLFG